MDIFTPSLRPLARRRKLAAWPVAVGAALALLAADGVAGKRGDENGRGGWGSRRGEGPPVSLDEAVSSFRRGGPGRVLSADTVDKDGRPVHRIKILTDKGRVKRYEVDGQTGNSLQRGKGGKGR